MKRAVFFADIHGNITGLREVIREIDKLENVTHIVCLGDYFGYGAGHNEIIDLCLNKKVILLRGNHEVMMNEIDENKDNDEFYPSVYFTHDWLLKNLKREYYEYIKALPMAFELKLNGKYSLIAFHAALNDTKSRTCSSYVTLNVIEETYGTLTQNIIVYGHNHEPHIMPFKDKLLINCSSVGMRKYDCLSNYTIIEYDNEKIAIIQKQVPYDKNEENELIVERSMTRTL